MFTSSNPVSSFMDNSITVVTQEKRGTICTEVNGTTYQSENATFDIYCSFSWPIGYFLQITYTVDFPTCMNDCAQWNTRTSVKCIGVGWRYGIYGPLGVEQG